MAERVLLVEDDVELGKQVERQLQRLGLQTLWVQRGDLAASLDPGSFGLVVLDLMLPGMDGLDVLKKIRARSDAPVLVLSARADPEVKVRALQLGADDFLSKPFFPEELAERVKARLRRPVLSRNNALDLGRLRVDLDARSALLDGQPLDLTPVEFGILEALARKARSAVSRRWLADHVLDPDRDGTERTLDVHVSRLRKKLGDARLITTVWGIGYRLDPEP